MKQADRDKVKEVYLQGVDLDQEARGELLAGLDNPRVAAEVSCLWQNGGSGFDFETLRTLTARIFDGGSGPASAETANQYKVLETIEQGGMGTVYKAEQQGDIKRIVALKILGKELAGKEHFQRFRAEQKALALMTHPNIASVYDAGMSTDGRPFYTLEYLDPLSLSGYCDKHKLTLKKRVQLVIKVCEAIQYAHQKGVVHRDIKPSNILLSTTDNRVEPKVIDFGLAKLLDRTDDPLTTRVGTVMGTPGYMSPEQAGGRPEHVDTRCDIYSLGVLLYELLTGVTPLGGHLEQAGSQSEVRRIIEEVDPLPPSLRFAEDGRDVEASLRSGNPHSLSLQIAGELDWIVGKAMEKDPNRRYASCSELAADLRWYLEDLPVSAGPPGRVYHLKKLAHRYRAVLLTAAVVALALLAGFSAAFIGFIKATRAKSQALISAQKLQAVNEFYLEFFDSVDPANQGREVKAITYHGLRVEQTAEGWLAEVIVDI